MQKLTVINRMLATMGQAPLNSLTEAHAFRDAGVSVLDFKNQEIQAEGWWFNLEQLKLSPSPTDSNIYLPGDSLEVRTLSRTVVERDGRLYNLDGDTYTFTEDQWVVLVREVPFEQLPHLAAAYIAAEAVLDFQKNYDGDGTRTQRLERDVAVARAKVNAAMTRNRRPNFINSNIRLQQLKLVTRRARWNRSNINDLS